VSEQLPGGAVQDEREREETYCYGHPKTPTRLRCSRCDRPICGRCAIPASVGQHCPECVAEARRTTRRPRSVLRATAPVVLALIVANVLMYVAQRLIPALTFQFGSFPPAIADGEWWRLMLAMFLHSRGFALHIFMNMYVLYIYGPDVEQVLGSARFLALYLVAGFVATATSFALGPCDAVSVGASGAIFGVVGALLVYVFNRRGSPAGRRALNGLLVIIGLNLVFGFLPGIDQYAHIGGLAAGVAVGAGFEHRARSVQIAAAAGVAAAGLALVLWRIATFTCA